MSKLRSIENLILTLSPLSLLVACSSDVIDLGNGNVAQRLALGTRCAESAIATGPVVIANQADLGALEGCEEIRGDLEVQIFEGTDLSPLASLRAVTGRLRLGTSPDPTPETEATWQADEDARQQIVAAGWLASLHGFEALQRVGSLELSRIAAPDLLAFQNLRNVASNDTPEWAGIITLQELSHLVDLTGLQGVTGLRGLDVSRLPLLESLNGLTIPPLIPDYIGLYDNPRLTDLSALSTLVSVDALAITNSGVQNLDALANLVNTSAIDIRENPELVDSAGLANASFDTLSVEQNPKLLNLPDFPNGKSFSRLRVVGNDELSSVFLRFTTAFASGEAEGVEFQIGNYWIDISDNAKLQNIAVFDSEGDTTYYGITAARVFAAYRNASLTQIDLGSLRSLDLLKIGDNPQLTEVRLGDLKRSDVISVTDNPSLSTTTLRGVQTFEGTFTGNAD